MMVTPFGDNVRIRTESNEPKTQDYEVVEEKINGTWIERHRYGHQSDDYAMTNSKALARSLATKYIGGTEMVNLAPKPFHIYSRGGNPPPVVKQQPKGKVKTPWGDIPASIENALRDYGPMTAGELVRYVPGLPNDVRKACQRMLKVNTRRHPIGEQRIHIKGWTHDTEGQRDYPRAIYALGHGENKPKPKAKKRKDVVRQWDQTTKARMRTNFVFNLGGAPCQ